MGPADVASLVVPAKGAGQDRIGVFRRAERVVIVVADGSGGTRGGAQAAEHAVRMVAGAVASTSRLDAREFVSLIAGIDSSLAPGGGQCALVVAAIDANAVIGASAGDCGAWLITERVIDLTEHQNRKPLVGSGGVLPAPFEAELGSATLLLASDGLLKYARPDRIAAAARGADFEGAVRELSEIPRLRSGKLQDDLAVVLCRKRRR